ncbi:MAG: hypothetical protein HOP11_04595 [Saprospiraceae bacterium]|nr:hypothetical protein [Saprospiraceae bacterium]
MDKSLKYFLILFLLIFARGCDFYSTSLWIFQEGGLEDETNPLTQFFGVGWNGLVLVNIIVTIIIGYCFYIYMFKYKVIGNLKFIPESAIQYASILYYEKKNQLWKLLYKIPNNKLAAVAHTGYVATWGIIIASIIVTIHNLLQFYENQYYDIYLEFVKYPRPIFYIIIFSPMILLSLNLYNKEFQEYKLRKNRHK